jgi:hypothetical protein
MNVARMDTLAEEVVNRGNTPSMLKNYKVFSLYPQYPTKPFWAREPQVWQGRSGYANEDEFVTALIGDNPNELSANVGFICLNQLMKTYENTVGEPVCGYKTPDKQMCRGIVAGSISFIVRRPQLDEPNALNPFNYVGIPHLPVQHCYEGTEVTIQTPLMSLIRYAGIETPTLTTGSQSLYIGEHAVTKAMEGASYRNQ